MRPMRILIGLLLILGGAALFVSAGIGGDFGDRHLWAVVLGGGAVFFGIGMLLRGAMRLTIFVLGGLCVVFALGMGVFDLFA